MKSSCPLLESIQVQRWVGRLPIPTVTACHIAPNGWTLCCRVFHMFRLLRSLSSCRTACALQSRGVHPPRPMDALTCPGLPLRSFNSLLSTTPRFSLHEVKPLLRMSMILVASRLVGSIMHVTVCVDGAVSKRRSPLLRAVRKEWLTVIPRLCLSALSALLDCTRLRSKKVT